MGVTNFDVVQANLFLGGSVLTQGNQFFVKPRTGSDGASGRSPKEALKTLAAALSRCVANQNDIVFLISEHNDTAASTTDQQSATLDWNKDLVHLIGINAGGPVSMRSRIGFTSSYDTASNLFTLSADACRIENIHFFAGVAGTNPTGCMKVTGDRNLIRNCHIAGIGNNNNDIAGAYSLLLDAGHENLFDDCTIGLDTIARGTAANSGLLVDGSSSRNEFRGCRFIAQVEHATNHVHVRLADTTAIDRYLLFKECVFYYMSPNFAVGATGIMNIPNLTQGYILVDRCFGIGDAPGTVPKWDVNDNNKVYVMHSPTPAADTVGIARPV